MHRTPPPASPSAPAAPTLVPRSRPQHSAAKRVAFAGGGWLLLLVGVAAIVLPGPGLLFIAGGLALLAQEYDWAHRWFQPIEKRARVAAIASVATPLAMTTTVAAIVATSATSALWIARPPAPSWWTLEQSWWLYGGVGAGAGMAVSAGLMVVTTVVSVRMHRASRAPATGAASARRG